MTPHWLGGLAIRKGHAKGLLDMAGEASLEY